MECPFCAETIRNEAVVCKNCSRDLRIVRPVLFEIEELVAELDGLRRELDYVNAKLDRLQHPFSSRLSFVAIYVLLPALLLVAAHIVVTIILDVTPLYLRLASVVIPMPFGLMMHAREKVGLRGAVLTGAVTAAVAISSMLTVTGLNDNVPIVPGPWTEWREAIEYGASIALAMMTGNIVGTLIFQVMPKVMTRGRMPNPVAYSVARLFGQHVGEEQLRRRARFVQDLFRTAGPLIGIVLTTAGSLYTGLKGILAW
jgi:hypothetical protein